MYSYSSTVCSCVTDTSQPADTLLSQVRISVLLLGIRPESPSFKINKGHGPTGSMTHRLVVLARQAGPVGIWAGLGPRMVMTAGLVAGQFLIYGAIKEGASPTSSSCSRHGVLMRVCYYQRLVRRQV
jgi:hypothetical protein